MTESTINDFDGDETAETSRDRFSKYLELLDEKSEDAELWAEFEREVRQECLRRPTLRRDSERWVQETLTAVMQYRATIRSPLAYAIGILDHLIRKAIREEIKARREANKPNEPVTFDSSAESDLIAKQQRRVDSLVAATLKECLSSVVSGMSPQIRQLFFDYYALDTHDRRAREVLVEKYELKTYNNLQVKIHRVSKKITALVMKCMAERDSQLNTREDSERRKLIKNYIREILKS